MRNVELKTRTQKDIDEQVAKILRDLGNPPPPLRLADVRALLKLDLRYYSSSDTGFLQEKIHQLRIGTRQIIARPTLLLDAVKKLSLKALLLPDQKRILIDTDEPPLKHRWNEAHEVGHGIIPWHKAYLHGDSQRTLKPVCHYAIEGEANYAAGRLLFLQDRFRAELLASPVDMDAIKTLKKTYGNTMTTTLWRAVEHLPVPAVGIVSVHPLVLGDNFSWLTPCRYFIRSAAFAQQFSNVTELDVFNSMRGYCSWKRRGPLGEGEVIFADANGDEHVFYFESFNNTHDTLTLGTYRKKKAGAVLVSA